MGSDIRLFFWVGGERNGMLSQNWEFQLSFLISSHSFFKHSVGLSH